MSWKNNANYQRTVASLNRKWRSGYGATSGDYIRAARKAQYESRQGQIKKRTGGGKYGKSKFAVVSYSRDVEKKYLDRALISQPVAKYTSDDDQVANLANGVMFTSQTWNSYNFAGTPSTTSAGTSNNLARAMAQGTTAETRIGNKITCKYIKGAITLNAAKSITPATTGSNQYGESVANYSTGTNVHQYLRTSCRYVIVKDLQVNSTNTTVTFEDVFASSPKSGTPEVQNGYPAGVHCELNIANMGRFRVIQDKFVTLDGDDPQKTLPFKINGSDIGSVRYNGPSELSLSDKGIYIIWAAYVNGITFTGTFDPTKLASPTCTMHSRLCFTDA